MNYIPPGHATRASVKKNKGQNGPPKASKMPPPIVDDPNSADGLKHILVSKTEELNKLKVELAEERLNCTEYILNAVSGHGHMPPSLLAPDLVPVNEGLLANAKANTSSDGSNRDGGKNKS
ncbi:hypothetical protein MGN70_013354 [Eutypa lata]|nr:hypothetical protein MGN70_013354 [Eutypa lata]